MAEPLHDEREDLAQWAAVILAPELLHHLARGRDGQARALLHDHHRQQLYALAVVLAARGRRPERGDRTRDADLVRAVAADSTARVGELLQGLALRQLHELCLALALRVPKPRLRPDDGLVDEVAVHRAASGQPVLLTRPERDLTIQLLAKRGVGYAEIAERLEVPDGVVSRVLYKQPRQLDLLTQIEESPLR